MKNAKTLGELSDQSGIPARTIRFYIARGLLNGPLKAGRGAVYTDEHLQRLKKIKELQAEGRMLSEIARDMADEAFLQPASEPTPWLQYTIVHDVMVWARGDVSPWRAKRIRAAIEVLVSALTEPQDNPQGRHRP